MNITEWKLVPRTLPVIMRKCPKCGKRENFINSKKFRINANKNHLDIWLIYQCSKCKSTWNMTIYERIRPQDMDRKEYESFLRNDISLVERYGFDVSIHQFNGVELSFEDVQYEINEIQTEEYSLVENMSHIRVVCGYPLSLRADKLIGDMLGITRNKVKSLYDQGYIMSDQQKNWLKKKVKDGMNLFIRN